ncbi:MAG: hypothetical protein GQ564_01665 [Bacteroidales bacterium]|nr:hypothetical protein [Bacteroidales bacterium]
MKPKIDLESSNVKKVLDFYTKEVEIALGTEQIVEKSVLPIYSVPITKAHQKKKNKPIQIGTGILVKIEDHFFVFGSTHVFCEFENKALLIGTLEYSKIEEVSGERYSTGNLEHCKIDKYDASVFHIQSTVSENLRKVAIGLDYFDLDGFDRLKPVYMITGFLAKKSNTSGNIIKSKAKNISTIEIDDYAEYGYDKNTHIVLAYEDQVVLNGNWQTSPKPIGMSGGAIIKAQGTSLIPLKSNRKNKKQLLSAITIEQYRDNAGRLGVLIGTRINVHLGLVDKFMPDLLKSFLDKYK